LSSSDIINETNSRSSVNVSRVGKLVDWFLETVATS